MTYESLLVILEMWYRLHYKKSIGSQLTPEQKQSVIMRISDLTLERAIWMDHKTDYRKQFPELTPYITNGVPLTGLYLTAIMKEIFQELHPENAKQIGIFQGGL